MRPHVRAISIEACAGDDALREEVDAMLAAHHDAGEADARLVSGSIDDVRRFEAGAIVGPVSHRPA